MALVSCGINSLNDDESEIANSKAHSAGKGGPLPRDATRRLAIWDHPKGAHGGLHLPTGLVTRVIIQ